MMIEPKELIAPNLTPRERKILFELLNGGSLIIQIGVKQGNYQLRKNRARLELRRLGPLQPAKGGGK